jgi:hypothetical protein
LNSNTGLKERSFVLKDHYKTSRKLQSILSKNPYYQPIVLSQTEEASESTRNEFTSRHMSMVESTLQHSPKSQGSCLL